MFKYSPREGYGDEVVCCGEDGEDYPSVHLDISPEQAKGVEVGDTITVTIVAKVDSIRMDTADRWSTGASLGLSLRSSDIKSGKEQDAIDSLLDEE